MGVDAAAVQILFDRSALHLNQSTPAQLVVVKVAAGATRLVDGCEMTSTPEGLDATLLATLGSTGSYAYSINASHAAGLVDRRLVNAARALGASRLVVLRAVLLPGCMPMIFTGARIALAFAWASIIAAELAIGIKIAGQGRSVAGIGQLMVETLYVKRDVDALVFYMLVIGAVSLLIDAGLRRLQRRMLPWNAR